MMGNETDFRTKDVANASAVTTYRMISLGLAVAFGGVGILFLMVPGGVLHYFNDLSVTLGLQPSPVEGINFYLILAAGYMYVVTLLAWFMYRQPTNRFFPVLLLNAKLASSIFSLIFFLVVGRALIYLTNGIIDGLIGIGVLLLVKMQRRME